MQNVVAIAASTAFPPSFSTSTPISEQTPFSLATAPFFASIRYAGFLLLPLPLEGGAGKGPVGCWLLSRRRVERTTRLMRSTTQAAHVPALQHELLFLWCFVRRCRGRYVSPSPSSLILCSLLGDWSTSGLLLRRMLGTFGLDGVDRPEADALRDVDVGVLAWAVEASRTSALRRGERSSASAVLANETRGMARIATDARAVGEHVSHPPDGLRAYGPKPYSESSQRTRPFTARY